MFNNWYPPLLLSHGHLTNSDKLIGFYASGSILVNWHCRVRCRTLHPFRDGGGEARGKEKHENLWHGLVNKSEFITSLSTLPAANPQPPLRLARFHRGPAGPHTMPPPRPICSGPRGSTSFLALTRISDADTPNSLYTTLPECVRSSVLLRLLRRLRTNLSYSPSNTNKGTRQPGLGS